MSAPRGNAGPARVKHGNAAIFIPHAGCPHRCSFCDQRAVTGRSAPPSADAVRETLHKALTDLGERAKNVQIAFFGGSFTALPFPLMTEYLETAREFTGAGKFSGIRLSTRPDAVDGEIIRILKEYRVDAVELGVQSMLPEVLLKNRRGHTPEDARRACALIRESGIELGVQMMTGLPGDTDEGAVYTAQALIAENPVTARIYPAVVMKHTLMARWYERGEYMPQTLEGAAALCARLLRLFHAAGVRVIRTGLHTLEDGAYLAGPYHPAFAELCAGRIYLDNALKTLKLKEWPPGRVKIAVPPGAVSKMAGQNRRNLHALAEQGYDVTIIPDPGLSGYELKILP